VARRRVPVDVAQLRNWKLIDAFRSRVLPLLERRVPHPSEEDPRRVLEAIDYFSAFLMAVFNPAISSLRALCEVSHCGKMRAVTQKPLTASSFSEAQHLFSPKILDQVARQLTREVGAKSLGDERHGGDARVRQALKRLSAIDGTVWRGVNRMLWAPAAGSGQAVRLHLHFAVFEQTPEDWTITPGSASEPHVLAQKLQKGAFYVIDRLYAQRHQFLQEMQEAGADFVVRLNNNVILTPEAPERPLSPADRQAGVVWDRPMRLGVHGSGPVIRVVRVQAQDKIFHLATSRQDLEAELIGLIYRQRWEIEVFFKWIKTLLNGGHWFAESPAGAQIQIYCVLICALLLMLWTGARPNKRMIEALRFYQMGWATQEELALLLKRAQGAQKI